MEQSDIFSAINEWLMRLQACVRAKKGILSKCCDTANNLLMN